jgi:hypothetical protein
MDENYKKPDASSSNVVQSIHNNLLELVQKNKTIPAFLQNLTANDPQLHCLKKAIRRGNFRAKIWNNRDCNLYLIYLIQEKMIPFWQGITAYVYLIAKMQYTQTQDLRAEDQDVKFNYQVEIVPLVKGGKITILGYQYLLGMIHALENLNAHLNFDQLVDYVVKLPGIERWLIKTEFDHHLTQRESKHDANRLVWVLINNLPLIQKISAGNFGDPTTHYLTPSSSLINYVLQALNQQPLRMRPVLGNPGLETLYKWHSQNFHPVALYAPQILSNPKDADGYRCGPFPLWLHDIGHTFWGSMLAKIQRDYIFTTYIPALRNLRNIAEMFGDESSMEYLEEAEIKAYDFDLTAIMDYANVKTRFTTYLAHTMGKNPIYPSCIFTGIYEYEAIGRAEGDTFYFLLHYGMYAAKVPDAYKKVYETLISFISIGQSYRKLPIVEALQRLAKNAVIDTDVLFAADPPVMKLNTLAWYRLLSSGLPSAEVWDKMTRDDSLADELLQMIQQGLNFFSPYLPITPPKRLELLNYLEKQQPDCVKISKDQSSNAKIVNKFRSQFFKSLDNETGERSSAEANYYSEGLKYN